MIRPLHEQFEAEKVQEIREIQSSFNSLPFEGRAAKYFIIEIISCLDAGLLLAALEVATTFLELFVRDLLVIARCGSNVTSRPLFLDKVRRELEDEERLSFGGMVDELEGLEVIDPSDAHEIKDFYKTVRVPVHHGLTRRLICGPSYIPEDFYDWLFSGPKDRLHEVEKLVEDDSIRHLSDIANFIVKYCKGSD